MIKTEVIQTKTSEEVNIDELVNLCLDEWYNDYYDEDDFYEDFEQAENDINNFLDSYDIVDVTQEEKRELFNRVKEGIHERINLQKQAIIDYYFADRKKIISLLDEMLDYYNRYTTDPINLTLEEVLDLIIKNGNK